MIRLLWGLLYWNLRKSWFRSRRGRVPCPCQSPGDSGHAYATACEACLTWSRPSRFRAVCPLLVRTPEGLRCSTERANVRPFWGRAATILAGGALALALVAATAAFVSLRTIGIPVTLSQVTLPSRWQEIPRIRGDYFLERYHRAAAAGNAEEALLHLESAHRSDPENRVTGLLLAKHLQARNPERSDGIYRNLIAAHPAHRHAIAQDWFRALLARGNMERVADLALGEIISGAPAAPVWVRALLFARRRMPSLDSTAAHGGGGLPGLDPWLPLFRVEKLLREGRFGDAVALLERDWPGTPDDFEAFYQSAALLELGRAFSALEALARKPDIRDGEVLLSARLGALAAAGAERMLRQEVDRALATRLAAGKLAVLRVLSAHLIRHPDKDLFGRVLGQVRDDSMPFNDETSGVWFSLFCAAGAVGDESNLGLLAGFIRDAIGRPFFALGATEAFFRGDSNETSILPFLPSLPLPLEVTYALLERYPGRDFVSASPYL